MGFLQASSESRLHKLLGLVFCSAVRKIDSILKYVNWQENFSLTSLLMCVERGPQEVQSPPFYEMFRGTGPPNCLYG